MWKVIKTIIKDIVLGSSFGLLFNHHNEWQAEQVRKLAEKSKPTNTPTNNKEAA